MRGEAGFGTWLEVGPLAELEIDSVGQAVGLWDLLWEGSNMAGFGEMAGAEVIVWGGVEGVSVGVWEGVDMRVRVV